MVAEVLGPMERDFAATAQIPAPDARLACRRLLCCRWVIPSPRCAAAYGASRVAAGRKTAGVGRVDRLRLCWPFFGCCDKAFYQCFDKPKKLFCARQNKFTYVSSSFSLFVSFGI